MKPLLLCTDLDRTLLPNGPYPESPSAREYFAALASLAEVQIAFVTGRHRALIDEAISRYKLPSPDYVIADVGTTLYHCRDDWQRDAEWEARIATDWHGLRAADLRSMLTSPASRAGLRLQEAARQRTFKLSFEGAAELDESTVLAALEETLQAQGVSARLVWSVDETSGTALLDVLPPAADKLHAIRFLQEKLGLAEDEILFAGDSGNDLTALRSGFPAVLVANATAEVRAQLDGGAQSLYLARGNYLGMNGNYSAGILEGVAHFRPDIDVWLRSL